MIEDDIYKSKQQWETVVKKVNGGTYLKPAKDGKTKYHIKNKDNLSYFKRIIRKFDVEEMSYIRRIAHLKALRKVCFATTKDLKDMTRDDVEDIILFYRDVHKSINSKRDFVNYCKYMWKIILPERDAKGRVDETIIPYAWRIKVKQDKSLEKERKDKLSVEDYEKLQESLSNDTRMQLYFSMLFINLARPQELCYINIENVTIFDNYARVKVAEHGKEGTKELQLIDNFYYLTEWALNKHPLRHDKKAPLFITMGNNSKHKRLNPKHANKILRTKLKELGIDKRITNYSLKRGGVTTRYLNGESAQSIQKIAGWTSTAQIKTYDLSEQKEFLDQELIAKGIIEAKDKGKRRLVTYKQCFFCQEINPVGKDACTNCKRPLDRTAILEVEKEKDDKLKRMDEKINKVYMFIEQLGLDKEILEKARMRKLGRTIENEQNN